MIKSNNKGRKALPKEVKKKQLVGSAYVSELEILAKFKNISEARKAANQAVRDLF